MNNRPRIAALESVEANSYAGKSFSTGVKLLAVLISAQWLLAAGCLAGAWGLAHMGRTSIQWEFPAMLTLMAIGIACWSIIKYCTPEFYWKTDDLGLTARSLLHKRMIKWSDIRLITPTLSTFGLRLILQHTGWNPEGGEVLLLKDILSFWEPTPDNIPREMDWGNPNPPNIAQRLLLFFLTGCALLAVVILLALDRKSIITLWPMIFSSIGLTAQC